LILDKQKQKSDMLQPDFCLFNMLKGN